MKVILEKKFLFFIIFLNIVFISCKAVKSNLKDSSKELFATINDDSYSIRIDTLVFKKRISENIFSSTSNITYDKIEVKKQLTIGEEKSFFYYVQLTNYKKNLKTTRWLERINDKLYLNNSEKDDDTFKLQYASCQGINDCTPNVYISDKKRFWICGEIAVCSNKKDDSLSCTSSKSIISP